MSIRLRIIDGHPIALCAARSIAKPGDIYISDLWHGALMDKAARDFNEMYATDLSHEYESLVEAEEDNNTNRTIWNRHYGTD